MLLLEHVEFLKFFLVSTRIVLLNDLSFNMESMYILQKVARRLIFGKGQEVVENETDDRRRRIRKFKESAWKCIYFLSAEVFALVVTYNEPWFTNTRYFWVGPGDQVWPDQMYK